MRSHARPAELSRLLALVQDWAMNQFFFRCAGCNTKTPRHTRAQRYCKRPNCQKTRKNAWRRHKYATDREYRIGQRESTQTWFDSRGGASAYFREYRRKRRELSEQPAVIPEAALAPELFCAPAPVVGEAAAAAEATHDRAIDLRTPEGHASEDSGKRANSDATLAKTPIIPGRYVLSPVCEVAGANSDAYLVDLDVISTTYATCKERLE